MVRAAEFGIPFDGDGPDPVGVLNRRHIQRAAAVIEHDQQFLMGLLEAVVGGRGDRFFDEPDLLEPGDAGGGLGGLSGDLIEVCRVCDNRVGNGLTELGFGGGLQFLQDTRRQVHRRPFTTLRIRDQRDGLALVAGRPHASLEELGRLFGFQDQVALGDQADHRLGPRHRHQAPGLHLAVAVGDDLDHPRGVDVGDRTVGRAQVNADCFVVLMRFHGLSPCLSLRRCMRRL